MKINGWHICGHGSTRSVECDRFHEQRGKNHPDLASSSLLDLYYV
jgi:hypothetical protein